jgi:hypothetical protein
MYFIARDRGSHGHDTQNGPSGRSDLKEFQPINKLVVQAGLPMPFRDVLSGGSQLDFSHAVRFGAQPVTIARPNGFSIVGLVGRIARDSLLIDSRGKRMFVVADA